ncbi:acyl-CoA thioesterase [Subtercola boreus]|uniref:Thioesterase n=1 Tax=Subtercola boreus TaxID=120213 RepID=A0A3E0W9K8_9MICO|nr:thioesterase family protein [Subtercola boreus]RFA19070.1 thioesterase [Subtercola boreus]RFA19208.1 thioesterase [Subtercola boreus]RFA25670.1 thioesterase [Subtercola boreus]
MNSFSRPFATRWNDNDVFGHLNNTVYYTAMDTTITAWLIGGGHFDIETSDTLAFCVSSSCRFIEPAAFPDTVEVVLRAGRVGTTSIAWQLELFRQSDGTQIAAGEFVHVFVGRGSKRPVPIPETLRAAALAELTG